MLLLEWSKSATPSNRIVWKEHRPSRNSSLINKKQKENIVIPDKVIQIEKRARRRRSKPYRYSHLKNYSHPLIWELYILNAIRFILKDNKIPFNHKREIEPFNFSTAAFFIHSTSSHQSRMIKLTLFFLAFSFTDCEHALTWKIIISSGTWIPSPERTLPRSGSRSCNIVADAPLFLYNSEHRLCK